MNEILEIDLDNHVAVVQPGVTLDQLDEALAPHGLVYPVFPGESSASLGGNVATNAGGMRAVKYGVTRHQVLGLEAVLGTGEVIRTGGKFVKATTGYDLTQLIVGSEGTLALVTEVTLRLSPRLPFATTVLAPFATLDDVTGAVPKIVASGIGPLLVEYLDVITMDAITQGHGVELGVAPAVKAQALAYLVVVLEDRRDDRLDENTEELATLIADLGALDVYVLPSAAGAQLIEAREQAFWTAKAAGADDILDMVVPRASIPQYMTAVADLAAARGSLVVGCGHAGDGNVHLSVFQPDPATRTALIRDIFAAGMALGGAISGEHGIGTEKKAYLAELGDPARLALMRRIKAAFDPHGILNPGTIFDMSEDTHRERRPRARPHAGRVRRRHLLHESGHLGDALRRRARRGARDAGRARPLRRSGHGRRRRLRPHGRPARGDAAAPRPRPRQRARQPAQRAQGAHSRRQHRRRPRDLPQAVRRAARVRHRHRRPQRVALHPLVVGDRRGRQRRGRHRRGGARPARAGRDPRAARRHLVGRRRCTGGAEAPRSLAPRSTTVSCAPSPRCCGRASRRCCSSAAPRAATRRRRSPARSRRPRAPGCCARRSRRASSGAPGGWRSTASPTSPSSRRASSTGRATWCSSTPRRRCRSSRIPTRPAA